LLLAPVPRTLNLVEHLVAIIDTWSRLMLAKEHQGVCKRADDASITQAKLGIQGDLTEVHHGTTLAHGSDVGATNSPLWHPTP
jgi:hypothetical protein